MNSNPLNLTKEQLRMVQGKVTQEERNNLRQSPEWEVCLEAWLNSEPPSLIREWIAGPREELMRHLDSKTSSLILAGWSTGDRVEILQQLFPGPDPDEENEDEEETPLTEQERRQVLSLLPQE